VYLFADLSNSQHAKLGGSPHKGMEFSLANATHAIVDVEAFVWSRIAFSL